MSNDKWRFLETALGRLGARLRPNGFATILIDRLESAVSSADRSRIETARDKLDEFAASARQYLDAQVATELREPEKLGPLALVYELGQIDFAEHFATRVAQRRVPDAFMNALRASKYEPLLDHLYMKEMANVDLAKKIDMSEEQVGRSLTELRDLGIVDCRRDGRRLINFLTPQGRAALDTVIAKPIPPAIMREAVRARIEENRMSLKPHLRSPIVFDEGGEVSLVS